MSKENASAIAAALLAEMIGQAIDSAYADFKADGFGDAIKSVVLGAVGPECRTPLTLKLKVSVQMKKT